MAQDQELLTRVQAAGDTAQAAALIAQAAAQKGLAIDASELTAHFAQAAQTLASQALSDGQLEAVAGGYYMPGRITGMDDNTRMTLISVITLGLGCAVISIGQAAGDKMGTFEKKFC
ncbi:MAG: hypothetical protein FD135_2062 [Comamonadaceae bacterium]|nr:MAG: hypothetical protein FD135_2062 [Comamonadaceae bacterium]